ARSRVGRCWRRCGRSTRSELGGGLRPPFWRRGYAPSRSPADGRRAARAALLPASPEIRIAPAEPALGRVRSFPLRAALDRVGSSGLPAAIARRGGAFALRRALARVGSCGLRAAIGRVGGGAFAVWLDRFDVGLGDACRRGL